MRKTKRDSVIKALLIMSVLTMLTLQPASASAAGGSAGSVQLISSDARGVTVEVTAPVFELQAAPAASDAGASATGETCRSVKLAGYEQSVEAGQPQLPVKVLLLGVPSGADVNVSVQQLESHIVARGVSVCPAVTRRVEQDPDGIVTATTARNRPRSGGLRQESLLPGQSARVIDMGFMRSQRIVRVEVYPFQYNPVTGELRFSDKLRVAVDYGGTGAGLALAQTAEPIAEPAAFENSFRSLLLNYEEAKAWRVPDPFCGRVNGHGVDAAQSGLQGCGQAGWYLSAYLRAIGDGRPARDHARPDELSSCSTWGRKCVSASIGEADGKLDASDVVLFYGQGANTRYTDTNVYWLTYGGANGLRMSSLPSQGGGVQAASFLASSRGELNQAYVSSLPKLSGYDHWYGKLCTAPGPSMPCTESLTVSKKAATEPAATAELEVRLGGNMDRPHHVRLYVNSQQVLDDSTTWIGRTVYNKTVSFPHSYLVEGANQVKD